MSGIFSKLAQKFVLTGTTGILLFLNIASVQAATNGQRLQIDATKSGGKVSRIEGCNQNQQWTTKNVWTSNTIYTDSWYWQTCTSGARVQITFTNGARCRVHVPQFSYQDPYPVRYGTATNDNCKPWDGR